MGAVERPPSRSCLLKNVLALRRDSTKVRQLAPVLGLFLIAALIGDIIIVRGQAAYGRGAKRSTLDFVRCFFPLPDICLALGEPLVELVRALSSILHS